MRREHCPHCGEAGFHVVRLPKEVVAVMACQRCHELSVFFRNKIIPIDRKILETGTFEERKMHLADVIAQFLEAGLLPLEQASDEEGAIENDVESGKVEKPRRRRVRQKNMPITDQEMDRFVRIDLKCIDNPTYFKRIFG